MAQIHIWAPEAEAVELESNGKLLGMTKDKAGWWIVEAPFIDHGVDYAFRMNGQGPFPDPRSPWQPQGVHGPSRWVDHARFSWTDAGWQQQPLGSAVIYELHVGSFTPEGTFDAAINHLDHLSDLGITHVELMPAAEFSGNCGWGYDGVDLGRIHGKTAADLSGNQFVGCLQNHDQVGNHARGERISHLVSPGLARVGAALVFTAPFVPMIFQGEEWGASTPFQYFTDHEDLELGKAVREGRRKEFAVFGWDDEAIPDPQAEETFLRSKLDWEEIQREPHAEMLDWHRSLVALRRRIPALRDGRMQRISVIFDEAARWLVMTRQSVLV